MKYLFSQLAYLYREREARRNLGALVKYLVVLLVVITVFAVLFHIIMAAVEGQEHSWLTGFYWTLTVMSTLGFGDITFHSDIGRLFSMVVLLSGIVMLMIVLPFTFIRHFYAPWLEAQIRFRAPREVPPDTRGHVIICRHDSIAPGLIRKLEFNRIPYFVLEPDPVVAARMAGDELSVVTGEIDNRSTYDRLRVSQSRMVFVNAEDTTNSNITLTVRQVDRDVPVVALAEDEASVDILELSGATHVLALKHRLGEHLASRINAGANSAYVVGSFKDLMIAEFAVHDAPLAGKTLRETELRSRTGVYVAAVWDRGELQAAHPDLRLSASSVPIVIGDREQVARLDRILVAPDPDPSPVLVIGGGKVGRATTASLVGRGLPVRVVERRERVRREFEGLADRIVVGDAADRAVLTAAGLDDASAVVLSTGDDAVNIYLSVYCRQLKPELTIVSRITNERNVEAIYRAGADSVLSYASLGREYVVSLLQGREPILIGEGADVFLVVVPPSLAGMTYGESRIGDRTGLIVVAVEMGDVARGRPDPSLRLPHGGRLLMLGTTAQRQAFAEAFE
jgi:voltage-gated potassium channel